MLSIPVDKSGLYKYAITNVLILALAQNHVIFVKYASCTIVLCKNNVVDAIFAHIHK